VEFKLLIHRSYTLFSCVIHGLCDIDITNSECLVSISRVRDLHVPVSYATAENTMCRYSNYSGLFRLSACLCICLQKALKLG